MIMNDLQASEFGRNGISVYEPAVVGIDRESSLFVLSESLRSRRLCVWFFNAEPAEVAELRREFRFAGPPRGRAARRVANDLSGDFGVWKAGRRTKSLQPTPGSVSGLPGSRELAYVLGPAWLSSAVSLLRTSP